MLEAYKKAFSDEIKVFQLQRRMVGVEVAVGGFFNGKNFIHPININFEHKKLFPGDIGPPTGEMGTSMFWSGAEQSFQSNAAEDGAAAGRGGLRRLHRSELHRQQQRHLPAGIHGPLRLSDDQHPARGHDHADRPVFLGPREWHRSEAESRSGFQIGVRIVVPPFPFDDDETFDSFSKNAVIVFKKPPADEIHIEDVKQSTASGSIAGTSGVILIVVGLGQTMKQAQAQVYSRIKNVLIPNMYYRTDIGDRWEEDSDRLHNWGYLR